MSLRLSRTGTVDGVWVEREQCTFMWLCVSDESGDFMVPEKSIGKDFGRRKPTPVRLKGTARGHRKKGH